MADPRFRPALDQLMSDLASRPDLTGLLFFGSVQRGEPSAHSDLDLHAIISGNEHWVEGRLVHGVEAEISFGPARWYRAMLEARRPVVIHAFATTEVLVDRTGAAAELAALGRSLWAAGPLPLTAAQILAWRYRISDLARDLEDVPVHAPEARLLAAQLVPLALEAYCAFRRVWSAKPKGLIQHITALDPELGAQVGRFYAQGLAPDQALAIADRVLAPFGSRTLAYRSQPEPC